MIFFVYIFSLFMATTLYASEHQQYPQFSNFLNSSCYNEIPQPSAPDFEDGHAYSLALNRSHQSSPSLPTVYQTPPSIQDLEAQLSTLRHENTQIQIKNDIITQLVKENHEMLKIIMTTLQAQGIQMQDIENGQFRAEDQMIDMVEKFKKWKTEMVQSNEHIITKILKWFKAGFRITASTTASLTTYYTLAWFTAVLPAAITPPGWVLISTSLSVGALYYIASTI